MFFLLVTLSVGCTAQAQLWNKTTNYFNFCFLLPPSRPEPHTDGPVNITHCHDNSHSREDREREKKVARRRLYVASVICVVFMTGEVLGEFTRLPSTCKVSKNQVERKILKKLLCSSEGNFSTFQGSIKKLDKLLF